MVGVSEFMMLLGGLWGATLGVCFARGYGWFAGLICFALGGVVGLFIGGFGWTFLDNLSDRAGVAFRSQRQTTGNLWLAAFLGSAALFLWLSFSILRIALHS
jgi:hypothetical protein